MSDLSIFLLGELLLLRKTDEVSVLLGDSAFFKSVETLSPSLALEVDLFPDSCSSYAEKGSQATRQSRVIVIAVIKEGGLRLQLALSS
jgi:hypothetical protein